MVAALTTAERYGIALDFREKLRSCQACELHKTSDHGPVPWRGDIGSTFCFLGEAPSKTDAITGQPLQGKAGESLHRILGAANIPLSDCSFVNTVQCWPRANLLKTHIDTCRPWKHGQLEMLVPKFIITLGETALEALIGKWPKLRTIHGKPLFMEEPATLRGTKLWPTFNPAAISYADGQSYEEVVLSDIKKLTQWISDGQPWPETCHLCEGELYRYDPWGLAMCYRHAARQGSLFPEDKEEG